tara:strand:+ start:1052 stop:1474 length:423 start_codon:yes stop_codon:yes gene_type:complete
MKLKDITEASPGRRARGRASQAGHRMKSFAKRWMRDVSDEVEKLNPKMAGRIDWDTAQYLMNTGKKPKEAAKRLVKLGESTISRKEMKDVALFADDCAPTDKKKWKVSKRAAKRKFGEASSEAKSRYTQKHYRESGGSFK